MGECRLTVLMAVRNGSLYLRTAMDSILQQTYRDFRFLIVDDASIDDTRQVVRSYKDQRVQLICLDRNVGQTAALNIGLRQASTPWIARMDADDYSASTRLEEQMGALDADSSLGCVGTFAWTFVDDPSVVEKLIQTPVNHESIKRALLRGSPIIHGSMVVKREALLEVGGYNDRYRYSADVELYYRLLAKYRAANIPRELLGVRRHDAQGSRSRVAFDENIEIFANRLSADNYSSGEAAIVRASLAHLHLVRARFWGREGRYLELAKDAWRSLRISPERFLWHCLLVFVVGRLAERDRARLKRFLVRFAPGLRT